MPQIATRDFGLLDYDASAELHFPHGLPGFETQTRYILIQNDALAPLIFLQSVQTETLCFITVPVHSVDPGYQIGMMEEDQRLLQLTGDSPNPKPSELLLLAVLAATPGAPSTANLLAPVAINLAARVGVQAVRSDRRYSHQHPLPQLPVAPEVTA